MSGAARCVKQWPFGLSLEGVGHYVTYSWAPGTWTSNMAKIMGPILPKLSVLGYWAILLGALLESRYLCILSILGYWGPLFGALLEVQVLP